MNTSDIGLIGLAVMGENLVLNMESKGYTVSVFNRTTVVIRALIAVVLEDLVDQMTIGGHDFDAVEARS